MPGEYKVMDWGATLKDAVFISLYRYPLINTGQFAEELKISKQTANALIKDFLQLGILKELTGKKRNRLYIFSDYVNLFIQ